MLDPYLSDSLTESTKGRRPARPDDASHVVDPARLGFVDVVTSSHGHTDHLDPVTLQALRPRALVCPAGLRDLALERARSSRRSSTSTRPSRSAASASRPLRADHDVPGGAVSFVVECGRWTLYHSGDTTAYASLGQRLRPFALDIALLPINGQLGNMDGREAARVAKEAGARLAIPCHYDMFEFNTAAPDDFVATCGSLRTAVPGPRAQASDSQSPAQAPA